MPQARTPTTSPSIVSFCPSPPRPSTAGPTYNPIPPTSQPLLHPISAAAKPKPKPLTGLPTQPGVPTLYHVDSSNTYTEVVPQRFSTYYENIADADIPLPADFSAIAGNALAQSRADLDDDKKAQVSWACEGDAAVPADKDRAAFPEQTCSTHLQALVYFPDCVEEATLNSTYSSALYYTDNWCPEGWMRIPRLRFSIRYDLRKIVPEGWEGPAPLQLASGSSFSMHGDFINGWFDDAAESMLEVAREKREFGMVDGAHGEGKSGPTCQAVDADPSGGTSDREESLAMMGMRRAARRVRGFVGRRAARN